MAHSVVIAEVRTLALTSDLQEVFCVNIVAITGVNRVHPFTVFTHSVAVTIACED